MRKAGLITWAGYPRLPPGANWAPTPGRAALGGSDSLPLSIAPGLRLFPVWLGWGSNATSDCPTRQPPGATIVGLRLEPGVTTPALSASSANVRQCGPQDPGRLSVPQG